MRASLFSLLLALPAFCAAAGPLSPEQVIEATAGAVAERLEGRREYLEQHPEELHRLVDELLLPRFDQRYAAFLVLGREHWQAASAEQRDRFVAAFFAFLVRNYAASLLDFDPRSLVILPGEPPSGKRYTVHTEMRLDTGKVVPMDYRLRLTDAGWKVYDVRIEGVSYLQNYRNQFDAEIRALGLDAVIARLEQEGRDAAAGEPATTVGERRPASTG